MVTTELLYRIWEGIVTSHVADVGFTHETAVVKDQDAQLSYPLAAWFLPTTMSVRVADVNYTTFTLGLAYVDQTASDRSALEMMQVHARMEAIARQCWQKFHDDYLLMDGEFEGVSVGMEWLNDPVFTPIWDDGTMMRTGVKMEVSVKATDVECIDAYFA